MKKKLSQGEILQLELVQKNKQISELYVLIDTLQTNLRSAVSHLDERGQRAVNSHSFRWCTNWKPGDEKL